jgi:hypothetical protein
MYQSSQSGNTVRHLPTAFPGAARGPGFVGGCRASATPGRPFARGASVRGWRRSDHPAATGGRLAYNSKARPPKAPPCWKHTAFWFGRVVPSNRRPGLEQGKFASARLMIRLRESRSALSTAVRRRLSGCAATWEVRDADEHAIGVLHPLALAGSTRAASEIRAPGRQIIARFQAGERANDAGAFLNSDGLLLGRVEPTADGVNLQFSESVAEHPITKMLLLAAVVHYVVSSSQK